MNEMRPVLEPPGRASSHEASEREPARFSRHRYELPMLGVFLSLALVELLTVHLLVSLWSGAAAWVLSGLSVLAVVQIAWLIRGLVRHPHEIDETNVHVRYGTAGLVEVPLSSIVRADNVAFSPEEKATDVFRATLIASPNVALRLEPPVAVRRRQMSTITLRLDDPAAFLARLAEVRAWPSS
jgi:hypothetical protein